MQYVVFDKVLNKNLPFKAQLGSGVHHVTSQPQSAEGEVLRNSSNIEQAGRGTDAPIYLQHYWPLVALQTIVSRKMIFLITRCHDTIPEQQGPCQQHSWDLKGKVQHDREIRVAVFLLLGKLRGLLLSESVIYNQQKKERR